MEQKGKTGIRKEMLIQSFRPLILGSHAPVLSQSPHFSITKAIDTFVVGCYYFVFIAGSFQHPLERDLKLLVLLRASEGIYCDRLEEINVHPGSIGMKHEFTFS